MHSQPPVGFFFMAITLIVLAFHMGRVVEKLAHSHEPQTQAERAR